MWGESPSKRLGFDREFSEFICWKIDSGLAQYKLWYDARMQARRKVGKYGQEAKYKTLYAVLGIHDAKQYGDFTSKSDLDSASTDYLQAVIDAQKAGVPPPDITEWLDQRRSTEEDLILQEAGDGRVDW